MGTMSNEPLELFVTRVKPEWLDYNGHLNAAYYSVACNGAIERFLEDMGVGTSLARAGVGTAFALESHVTYQRELREGEPMRITLQLLDYDEKRFRISFFASFRPTRDTWRRPTNRFPSTSTSRPGDRHPCPAP